MVFAASKSIIVSLFVLLCIFLPAVYAGDLNLTARPEGMSILYTISNPGSQINANVMLLRDGVQIASSQIQGYDSADGSFTVTAVGEYVVKAYDLSLKKTISASVTVSPVIPINSTNGTNGQGGAPKPLFNGTTLMVFLVVIAIIFLAAVYMFAKSHIKFGGGLGKK